MKLFAIFFMFVNALMFAANAFAGKQALQFNSKNLNVAGDFPVNKHPLIISGFDNLEKPYKLEIQTQKQTGNVFKVTYFLYRGEKLDKSGTIITVKNQTGEMSEKKEGDTQAMTAFKVTISDY